MDMGVIFLPLLFVALVSLAAGILFGRMWNTATKKDEPAESDSSPESPPKDALHIWRHSDTQDFVLQFGERVYHSSDDLTPAEKETFASLFARMQAWLGVTAAPRQDSAPETASQPEGDKPSITPASVLSSMMPSIPEPAPTSIVAQIDQILQSKLAASPLKDNGIALQETLQGGMQVIVGLEKYDDIDSVPNEEIRVMIRAAVAEWEKQT